MNQKAATLLGLGPDGRAIETDPLVNWGFRYNARSNRWTRTNQWRQTGSFTKGLPRQVARSQVAKEVDIPEGLLLAWQEAMRKSSEPENENVAELLRLTPDGPINLNPLAKWRLEYFPQSRVWRKTRSHRNEVERSEVAKTVGVSEEIIQKWERAMAKRAA